MDYMKTGIIVVGVLLLAAVGYYLFMLPSPATEVPTDANSAKIDINAVCEGALAYMTFPSGAEAEAWVQDCKDGKHPEAIDQYKAQMGITDDRAI